MENQKSLKRKLGFIHNVSPAKKSIKGNPYYYLVLQIGENESTKIIGYKQEVYDKMNELS